jgi:hypothetical protein
MNTPKALFVRLAFGLALLGGAQGAFALDASQVRGGWEITVNGIEHIYELRIVGDRISGVYCTRCDDATTLAFVDGQLGGDQLTFKVTHVRDDGSTLYQDRVSGRLQNGHLMVSGHSGAPGGGDFNWSMYRDPRGLAPPGPAVPPRPRVHYLQPGPWEAITPDKLVGVWLAGTGANKQYFIIRRVGNTLRGVACGPCDDPYTMGALEDFFIQDDTVQWNICHEDWGVGPVPYRHQVVAHIARNELRLDAQQPNMRRVVSMTLFGPLRFAASARAAPPGEAGGPDVPAAAASADGSH